MVLMVGQGDVPDGAKTPRRKCKRESGTEGYGGKEREKVESPRIVWIQRSPLNRPLQAWPKPSAPQQCRYLTGRTLPSLFWATRSWFTGLIIRVTK